MPGLGVGLHRRRRAGSYPSIVTDGTCSLRQVIRDDYLCTDITLTAIGFDGVEDTDWENLEKSSGGWSSYWTKQKNTFINTLVTAGIWDKLDLVNIGFAPEDESFKNLKDDSVAASLSDSSVAHHENKVGFFSDGTTGSVDFDWNPATAGNKYSLNSAYFAVYSWLNFAETGIIAGCDDGTGYLTLNILRNTVLSQLRYQINMGGSTKNITYTGDSDGYFSLSKNNNEVTLARNGSGLNTSTVTTTQVPDRALKGLGWNYSGGVLSNPSFNKLGCLITGSYLTQEEDTILYNALEVLRNAISDYPPYYQTGSLQYSQTGMGNYSVKGVDGDYMFAVSPGKIYYSSNNGTTWSSNNLANAINVTFVKFFDTGTVLFGAGQKIYRSANALTSFTEITLKLPSGDDYVVHTPVSATYPGHYFRMLGHTDKMYRDGNEIFLWGNYCNSNYGAAPVNIYEATNDGQDITVIYQFGQNAWARDNGANQAAETGNLLGDATNPVIAWHVHSVYWDEATSTAYFCTGDYLRAGDVKEIHIGKLVYSEGVYVPTIIVDSNASDDFFWCSMFIQDGYIYFNKETVIKGAWKAPVATLDDEETHIRLIDTGNLALYIWRSGNNVYVTDKDLGDHVYISKDLGLTWEILDLTYCTGYRVGGDWPLAIIPMGQPDSNGVWWCNPYYLNLTTNNMRLKLKIV